MRIAILSDTHDDMQRLTAAMRLIDALKPEAIIHCGDICAPAMLAPLAGRQAAFVFGNNDFDTDGLREEARRLGIICLGQGGGLSLAGRSIAVCHGHDPGMRDRMIRDRVDYLFSGHTHSRHDIRSGPTRLINPGALFRAREKTIALLDLATDTLATHEVV